MVNAKTENGEGLSKKQYLKELRRLQVELCKLQDWVKHKGLRIILIFEGRDGAGKGGTIKAITERVSPRVFRVVTLPAPSDREKSQMYMQRYLQHFPAAGEIVIFDRSSYNRAGVEFVMGFCNNERPDRFLELCPVLEGYIVESGTRLIKFWLEVSNERAGAAFRSPYRTTGCASGSLARPTWNLIAGWFEYSQARDLMMKAYVYTKHAPWYIVRSDDKKSARLNCISHLLRLIRYGKVPREKVKLPPRRTQGNIRPSATVEGAALRPREVLTRPCKELTWRMSGCE